MAHCSCYTKMALITCASELLLDDALTDTISNNRIYPTNECEFFCRTPKLHVKIYNNMFVNWRLGVQED